MEDLLQVIVVLVIVMISIAIQFIKKGEKFEETSSPKDVLADMFPEITEEEQPVLQQVKVQKPKPMRKKHYAQPMNAFSSASASSAKAPTDENRKPECSSSVRLNNRKEARRAFIYSEIFNRKY